MKYYAIKRPDGSWIMCFADAVWTAWQAASREDQNLHDLWVIHGYAAAPKFAEAAGYTCVEVSGFVEVK